MGHEFAGSCEKVYVPATAKRALIGHFAAAQWKVVRDDKHCPGVAVFGPRKPGLWDEDFMVCAKSDHIYLLVHGSGERLIKSVVASALRQVAGHVEWEEL